MEKWEKVSRLGVVKILRWGFAILLAVSSFLQAQIILPVTYRGYVQSSGNSSGGGAVKNFVANHPGSITPTISWFGFDLSGQTATSIVGAKLYLYNPNSGITGNGTYTLWDVSSASKSLLNTTGFSGQTSVYADLGGGTSYASRNFTTADNANYLVFDLNASGLADLQAVWGSGFFHIGGAATGNSAFANSNTVLQNQTYLEIVPEPSSISLFALGLGGLAVIRRRRYILHSRAGAGRWPHYSCPECES